MSNFVEERAFGIIPIKKKSGVWHVFLVRLRSGRHWGFPKGHPHEGEEPRAAAERELKEETGMRVVRYFTEEKFAESYQFEREGVAVHKTATYFVAEVDGSVFLQREELLDGGWFPLFEAEAHLTYPEARSLCLEVLNIFIPRRG